MTNQLERDVLDLSTERKWKNEAGRNIYIRFNETAESFFGHELSEVEISASELMYLAQLYSRDGLPQDEMANIISVDKAATTCTMQGMKKKGLVIRTPYENDHRAKRVFLTDKAKEYEPKIRKLQNEWVDFITQDMTESETEIFAKQLR